MFILYNIRRFCCSVLSYVCQLLLLCGCVLNVETSNYHVIYLFRSIIWSHGRKAAGRQLVKQECVVGSVLLMLYML